VVAALCSFHPRVAVSLAVEDVAFGGIHAGLGVSHALRVAGAGASLLVVRTGGPHAPSRMNPPLPRNADEEGPALHAARWTRARVPSQVRVVAAGGLWTAWVMEAAVAGGACDAVLYGSG
jgi:hypothetical protein